MKPIQPKQPQQILPKPAGGSTQSKPVTLTQRTVGQPGGLVIGQNQAMLPNGNVATVSGHQLLLNHISLANMGHNQPFLISSGGAGLPSNLQLLVRPQTPGSTGHHHHHHHQHQHQQQQQQQHQHHHQQMTAGLGSQATNMSVNNAALLAAFQVQNQAAQQALIGPASKNLAGQGHAVMNLMGGSQNQTMSTQAGANLQQNMIVNARVVSPNQHQQLQLQQIQMPQGPITLAFGPGGQLRALPGQFSNVLQGVAISTATVASSTQTLATTSSGVGVHQHQQQQQQHQQHVMEVVQQQNKGVNLLGDLLKQTGIVPEDSPTSPNQGQESQTQTQSHQALTPPQVHAQVHAQQVHAQQAAVITVNALGSTPIMTVNSVDQTGAPTTTQCLAQPGALGNGTQTIVVNQGNIPVAKLQAQQANSQLKLSLAQDGSFILQKPFPNELGQQAVQSLLLQRLSTQPQHQQQQHQQQHQQAHIMNPFTASGANTSVTSSYIPVVVSNMNVCDPAPHKGTASTTCATVSMMSSACVDTVASTSTTAITTTPSPRSSSMLLSSMLNQSPSSVVHSLAQNGSTEALGLQQAAGTVVPVPVPVPANVNMVVTASTTNVTQLGPGVTVAKGCVDTATAGVIFGYPVASLQAGQKVQTVQLTPHNQEALQKVQTKLRALLSMGSHTQQQKQEMQSLQTAQQKILSKGKIISVQQVIPHQSPTQASLYVATPVSSGHTTSLSTVVSGTTAQFKLGNQIFTLAPQPAQSVHSAQKHVASNQQQQRFVTHSQGKDTIILKLPQQQQQSITTSGTGHHDGNVTALGNSSSNIVHIKTVGKVTTKSSSTSSQGPVNRGIKRSAVSTQSRAPTVQQQLANDQSSILNPDHKTPFKSVEEACRRLLQYHLYNTKTPTDEDLWKADDLFETASEQLLAKAQVMTNKYRYLILKDSMKEVSSSELVMLDRIFIQEETAALERDKQSAKEGKKLDLPPPPAHWLPKIKEENCAKRVAAHRITLPTTASPSSVHPGEVPREPSGKVMAKPPNLVVKREPGTLHCTVVANDVSTLTNPVVAAAASSTPSTTAVPSTAAVSCTTGNSGCTTVFLPGVVERNRLTVKKEMERPPSAERTGIGTRSAIGVVVVGGTSRTTVKSEPCPSEDNYDEWAEIQKELEMYPVDATTAVAHHGLETSSSEQLDFDPPEDGGPGLVDFEPPLPKSLKYDGNFLNASGGHQPHPPHPHPPTQPQQPQQLQCAVRKNAAGRWESMHVTSGEEMSTESSITRQQEQHQRSEVPDGILADMDGFNGRFSRQGATAKLDPGNGFGGLNFNKSSREEDAVVGGGDSDCDCEDDDDPTELKSQEEDLNAQVQCAINSILNLQRADESSDYETSEYNAFEVDVDAVGSKEEEEDEDEEEEEEVEEDEEEEHMTMDYDVNIGSGVAGVPDGNEMDAALEEAVKSIL